MKKINYFLLSVLLSSCAKQDAFLDVKSNKADILPAALSDYQSILDNDVVMNNWLPTLGLIATDNFYVDYTAWQATSTAQERNAYLWTPDIYNGEPGFDWQSAYQAVAYANIVLEGLDKKVPPTPATLADWNTARGSALFYRAFAFYELAQLFAAPYDSATAATTLGIPLKINADVNTPFPRSTLAETYALIHADVETAINLLPASAATRTKPTRMAAQALQARAWLTQGNYAKAFDYSNAVLQANSVLVDFNTFSTTALPTFPAYPNTIPEVLLYATANSFGILSFSNMKVDTVLYRSYALNDLRRSLFFRDNGATGISFKGDYTGTVIPSKFSGFATNEQYLIRAECAARLGNTSQAMNDLNALLNKRWKTGTFTPLTASSSADALAKIIIERRKELPYCCNLRWEDLRRLNPDPVFAKTLTRAFNGTTYSLAPNDPKYVYPIPDLELKLNSITQNPR